MRTPQRPTMVYDGDCAFCTRCVGWAERRLSYRPAIVAFQFADLEALGITPQAAERAVQWVEPDGRVSTGAAAVGRWWWRSGGWWWLPAILCLVPPFSWAAEVVYRLVARYRHRLPGGTAACAMPAHLRPGAQPPPA